MRVLVTGGGGKFGRFLVPELKTCRHHVTTFDRAQGSKPDAALGADGADGELVGDVEDLGAVVSACRGVDAILHLAGIPTHGLVPHEETFRVMGAFNVHEAAQRTGVPRVVSMSEAVLGWTPGSWAREHLPHYLPIDEDHPCALQDCYGLSKQVMEAVGRSFTSRCVMVTIFIRHHGSFRPMNLKSFRATTGARSRRSVSITTSTRATWPSHACSQPRSKSAHHMPCSLAQARQQFRHRCPNSIRNLLRPSGERAACLNGRRTPVSIERARQMLGWAPKWSWRDGNVLSAIPVASIETVS
jgi:dTDP-4-dehydrorhamnose reductase